MFVCLSQEYSFDIAVPSKSLSEGVICPPFHISHVCSQWRRVAISLPSLWTSISVAPYGVHKDVRPILATYIRNARDSPLKIRLSRWFEFRSRKKKCREYSENAYNYLLGRIDRCYELIIANHHSDGMSVPWDATPYMKHLPSLRILTIDLDTDDNYTLQTYLRNALPCAPNLTTLKMEGCFPEYPVYPLEQLEHFELRLVECDVGSLTRWLRLCTNLRNLVLPPYLDPDPDHIQQERKSIPSLTTLQADMYGYPDYVCPIFSVFQFPSLCILSMKIVGEFAPEYGWPRTFLDALRDSCRALKEFDLTVRCTQKRAERAFPISNILSVMPNLTSFKFTSEGEHPLSDLPNTLMKSLCCEVLRALTVGHTVPEDMIENGRLNEEAWRSHVARNPPTLLPKLSSLQLHEEV